MQSKSNKLLYLLIEYMWIYFSLIPTLMIVSLAFIKLDKSYKIFIDINFNILIILLLLIASLLILKRYIDKKMNNVNKMETIGNIKKIKNNEEYMVFNFFAIYLLPIVSINHNNILSLVLVLLLIVVLSYKANLYYYNIFLFLFYKYEKVVISNEEYFVISKRGSPPISSTENLYLIDEKIKLYIRYYDKLQP